MSPWLAKGTVLLAAIVMVAIRAPYGQRSLKVPVARSHRGGREAALLVVAWAAFFLPLLWIVTPWLSFADYPLRTGAWSAGVLALAAGLWLFWRSHRDLGANWSITLEVREGHQLVTSGVYRRIRHPMYLALLIYGAGQALALPNWIAGPSYLLAMAWLTMCRLGPEERMMIATFGQAYHSYRERSWRLLPGLW